MILPYLAGTSLSILKKEKMKNEIQFKVSFISFISFRLLLHIRLFVETSRVRMKSKSLPSLDRFLCSLCNEFFFALA